MADTPATPTPTVTPTVPRQTRPVQFIVEIASKKNGSVLCPVRPFDMMKCRGAWERRNLVGMSFDGEFAAMPDLPGICFSLNTSRRRIRRFDPLADPANEVIAKKAHKVIQQVIGEDQKPEPEKVREQATDDELKTFTFWCRRLVDGEQMRVVKGKVPEWEEIRRMPGRIMQNQFDQGTRGGNAVDDDKIEYIKLEKDDDRQFTTEDMPEPVINHEDGE